MQTAAKIERARLRVSSRALGASRRVAVHTLSADGAASQIVLDEVRSYEDAKEGIINLPTPGSGEDVFTVEIPAGQKFAHVDLIVEEAAVLAKALVEDRPNRGATGRKKITVAWSHPPWGAIKYRVQVYASPDGASPAIPIPIEGASAESRARLLIDQDVPFDVVLSGPMAETFRKMMDQKAKEQAEKTATSQAVTGIEIAAAVTISLALIALTAFALGLFVFAALCFYAMEKGYNLEDTGYGFESGEGESKQSTKMHFKVRKPGT